MERTSPTCSGAPPTLSIRFCAAPSRARGGVAARGARAAARADATHRRADGLPRERLGRTGVLRRIPGGTSEAWVGGGPQHPARHALGVARRRGGEAAVREGTRRATTRSDSFVCHTHHGRAHATYA